MAVQVNPVADVIGAAVSHLSLHSTDGGSTGSGELAGGSYARQVPDYSSSASGGSDDLAASVTFGGPGVASTAAYLGFWNGTTWLGSRALSISKPNFIDGDTLEVTSAPINVTLPS